MRLALALVLTLLAAAPARAAVTTPWPSALVFDSTPQIDGTGDGPVALVLYRGTSVEGAPVQALAATGAGGAWSAVAGPLAPGVYTLAATQADGASVVTFAVALSDQDAVEQVGLALLASLGTFLHPLEGAPLKVRDGRVALGDLGCIGTAACDIRAQLTRRGRRIGGTALKIQPGQELPLRVTLNRSARRRLGREGHFAARLAMTLADTGTGAVQRAAGVVTLIRR